MLVPNEKGYLIWAGAESLNRPDGMWKEFKLDHFLPTTVDYTKIRKIRLELSETGYNRFPVDISFINDLDKLCGSHTTNYNNAPANFRSTIYKDIHGDIIVNVGAEISAGISSNQLDLNHVLIYV